MKNENISPDALGCLSLAANQILKPRKISRRAAVAVGNWAKYSELRTDNNRRQVEALLDELADVPGDYFAVGAPVADVLAAFSRLSDIAERIFYILKEAAAGFWPYSYQAPPPPEALAGDCDRIQTEITNKALTYICHELADGLKTVDLYNEAIQYYDGREPNEAETAKFEQVRREIGDNLAGFDSIARGLRLPLEMEKYDLQTLSVEYGGTFDDIFKLLVKDNNF